MEDNYELLINEGISTYCFLASNNDKICAACSINNEKVFSVKDAEIGKIFPPMHPNCICSVMTIVNNKVVNLSEQEIDEEYRKWLNNITNEMSESESDIYNNIKDYANNYKSITINGIEYKYNPDLTQNIEIFPNGDIINGDKLTENDKKLLELMKLRGNTKDDEKRDHYQREIWNLYGDRQGAIIEVNQNYDYYTLTEDITDKLNDFMKQAVIDCEYVKSLKIPFNFLTFYF